MCGMRQAINCAIEPSQDGMLFGTLDTRNDLLKYGGDKVPTDLDQVPSGHPKIPPKKVPWPSTAAHHWQGRLPAAASSTTAPPLHDPSANCPSIHSPLIFDFSRFSTQHDWRPALSTLFTTIIRRRSVEYFRRLSRLSTLKVACLASYTIT